MSDVRFKVGTAVMCNLGPEGWKLGRVIALHYREAHWASERSAPYQVALEDDHRLIYVPVDDDRCCREPRPEDLRMVQRIDALAELGADTQEHEQTGLGALAQTRLSCEPQLAEPGYPSYRSGHCEGCNLCPQGWLYAELYSEHYRCAERNGLKVTHCVVDLGTVRVGDSIGDLANQDFKVGEGFLQAPTLMRLPPGLGFSDDGTITGEVRFDPHREAVYSVEFVAVSTAAWDNPEIGIVRLEMNFQVEGNQPPKDFEEDIFSRDQQEARVYARQAVQEVWDLWEQWEEGVLGNRETRARIGSVLSRLRSLLERHPRLDNGRWWAQLGGFYMNVHKLLENTLFECELYLGYALTFGDAEVRYIAERNLEGCYQKRLLEAARFMWIDGLEQMMRGEWARAARTLQSAAAQKDGWGWAVNYGDIWLSESAARLVCGAELNARDGMKDSEGSLWIKEASTLLAKGAARAETARTFLPNGHPWASELEEAFASYGNLVETGADTGDWLKAFKLRTLYWCAQVLGGASPFPPEPSARLDPAAELIKRLRFKEH